MKKKILSAVLACTATMALAVPAFAEDAGATEPAGSDEAPVVIEVTLKVGKDGISGTALNDKVLVDEDGVAYTWQDVESAAFESEDLFCVGFVADEELAGTDFFIVNVSELPEEGEPADSDADADDDDENGAPAEEGVSGPVLREDAEGEDEAAIPDEAFASAIELTEDLIALFDESEPSGGNVTIAPKGDEEIEVTATVTMKAGAEGTEPDPDNKPTGIALAVAPAGLAVAFVTVAAVMSKKKRG